METKDQLIANIKEYVKIDNEIRQLQAEMKKRKESKKLLSEKLVDVMRDNEIGTFDLNDGQLIYSQRKVKAPLSKKLLIESLVKFYQDQPQMVESLSSFIMDNRSEKIQETIRRKIDKN